MLTSLSIGNFKAFGETQTIPIRPITLIFGPNSSGKSSIIHSLLLANHGIETGGWNVHEPLLGGESVELGGFPHYLHQQSGDVTCHLVFQAAMEKGTCGLAVYIARSKAEDCSSTDSEAAEIQSAELLIDGQAALGFVRTGPGTFQCSQVHLGHPEIRARLGAILALALEHPPEWSAEDIRHCQRQEAAIAAALDEIDADSLGKAMELRERSESKPTDAVEALLLRQNRLAQGGAELLDEFLELGKTLKAVMGEVTFRLEDSSLGEVGGTAWWDDRKWQDTIECFVPGPVRFFREQAETKNIAGERWAEAQALRYDLNARIVQITTAIIAALRSVAYLGPLRAMPQRHSLQWARGRGPGGSGMEAWVRTCREISTQDSLNRWLSEGWLKTPYQLRVRPVVHADAPTVELGPPDLEFEDSTSGARLSHRDLGFGISQVLPVLAYAAAMRRHTVAIEQPELHLHPAMQAELGDVFIESALGERKNTFLLETHSEHLILRILRRIRETTADGKPGKDGLPPIRPEDVSVVYVQPGPKGAEVIELPVTPDGDFSRPWPKGFFAERFQELP